tara:strand:+ start:43971 stop:45431 length:1461 start_codon:yes stop_codon:yes gene_type:complete
MTNFSITDVENSELLGGIEFIGVNSTGITSNYTQTIYVPSGWSLISTYIDVTTLTSASTGGGSNNIKDIFDEFPDIAILKSNEGNAYLPEWGFNGIPDWDDYGYGDLGQNVGFQIKNDGPPFEFSFTGNLLYLTSENLQQGVTLNFPAGWSIVAWPFHYTADVEEVFNDYSDNILIMKDYQGFAWLPEWNFNGIGLVHPGRAYQVKVTEAFTISINSGVLTPGGGGLNPDVTDGTDEGDNTDGETSEGVTHTEFDFSLIITKGEYYNLVDSLDFDTTITKEFLDILDKYLLLNNKSIVDLISSVGFKETLNKLLLKDFAYSLLLPESPKDDEGAHSDSIKDPVLLGGLNPKDEYVELSYRLIEELESLSIFVDTTYEYRLGAEDSNGTNWSTTKSSTSSYIPQGVVQLVCPIDSNPSGLIEDGFSLGEEYKVILYVNESKYELDIEYISGSSTPSTDLNLVHDKGIKVIKGLSLQNNQGYNHYLDK